MKVNVPLGLYCPFNQPVVAMNLVTAQKQKIFFLGLHALIVSLSEKKKNDKFSRTERDSAADIEDGARTVSDAITEIVTAKVIEDDIICLRGHANIISNELTKKEQAPQTGEGACRKSTCYG